MQFCGYLAAVRASRRAVSILAGACLALALPLASARAGASLTLDEAWRLAETANPTLRTAQARLAAAEGELTDARSLLWNNPSDVLVAVTGDVQAKMMFEQQPMKMAAAEALCETETGAGFSIFAVGDVNNRCDVRTLTVPGLASFLATGDTGATLTGVNDLQDRYQELYGPGEYTPLLAVTYWSFPLMMGFGAFSAALALAGLWVTRRGATPSAALFGKLALIALPMPFLANLTWWIFTEMGRQPWIVAPNPTGDAAIRMLTAEGVSPTVDSASVLVSLTVFTLLYGGLAVIWFSLMRRYAAAGAPAITHGDSAAGGDASTGTDPPLTFAY